MGASARFARKLDGGKNYRSKRPKVGDLVAMRGTGTKAWQGRLPPDLQKKVEYTDRLPTIGIGAPEHVSDHPIDNDDRMADRIAARDPSQPTAKQRSTFMGLLDKVRRYVGL